VRSLYVPVRFAAAVLAVATAAGCVNVGADATHPEPSRSSGQQGGKAPDGGAAVPGADSGAGYRRTAGEGGASEPHGKQDSGESASASATPSGRREAPATPSGPRRTGKPGNPVPTEVQPPDSQTDEPTPTPTPSPPEPPASPSPPPSAEPSSSAHEQPSPQLALREPAPAAGVAV
jgi:hypothetical protein